MCQIVEKKLHANGRNPYFFQQSQLNFFILLKIKLKITKMKATQAFTTKNIFSPNELLIS